MYIHLGILGLMKDSFPSLFIGIAMAFNRPDENEKKLFIEKFSHLSNWFPHLTLEETIKKSQELMSNSLV